jgi:hypothetical protein
MDTETIAQESGATEDAGTGIGVATLPPAPLPPSAPRPLELGGPAGLEPTRYGDWERKGRCIDF